MSVSRIISYSSYGSMVDELDRSTPASVVVPEQERGRLTGKLSSARRATLASYVRRGGTLIVAHDNSLVNALFGLSISTTSGGRTITRQSGSFGTPFESAPLSITKGYNAVRYFRASSLPAGSTNLYSYGSSASAVATVPVGAGQVVLLGFDWFETMGSEWADVLGKALEATASARAVSGEWDYRWMGNSSVVLGGVACTGAEAGLHQCPYSSWNADRAQCTEDAVVMCGSMPPSPPPPPLSPSPLPPNPPPPPPSPPSPPPPYPTGTFDVRLVTDPASPFGVNGGRVEVSYGGTYGSICGNDWDVEDARVAGRDPRLTLA